MAFDRGPVLNQNRRKTLSTVQPLNTDINDPTRKRLQRLSQLMDTAIPLPGGMRIGWDGIIGLIPGVGDVVGLGVSSYIIMGAAKLGASKATLFRMVLNVILETSIGAIPLIGDVFDMVYKANIRNMALLEKQLEDPKATARESKGELLLVGIIFGLLLLIVLWIVIRVLGALFGAIF